MKLDFATFAFGYQVRIGGGTPNWATALGQGKNYKINNDPGIDELLKGIVYSSVPLQNITTKIGKGGRLVSGNDPESPIILAGLFKKVFINDVQILNGNFILLITRDDCASHSGRLRIKYGPHNAWQENGIELFSNQTFLQKAAEQLHLADNACWFVPAFSIENQDELHLTAVIVNANDSVEYEDSHALHNAWNALVPEELQASEPEESSVVGCNELVYGVPGAGKSWYVRRHYGTDELHSERIVFHPDYTYSDFVGQIMPVVKEQGAQVTYKFSPGPFTRILKKAINDQDNHYYLIIEEINRGNAPAIFGDIFQLLDRVEQKDENNPDVKKGQSVFGIVNADIAKSIYLDENASYTSDEVREIEDKPIRLPSNLSIVATMNTSDQNVFTLDTAFQRRWHMRMISNNFGDPEHKSQLTTPIGKTSVTWEKFLRVINHIIITENSGMNSCEDKRLGIYFVSKSDLKDVKCWAEKVIKYLWDDAFKFCHEKVFVVDEDTCLDTIIEKFSKEAETPDFSVFSKDILDMLFDENNNGQVNGVE